MLVQSIKDSGNARTYAIVEGTPVAEIEHYEIIVRKLPNHKIKVVTKIEID